MKRNILTSLALTAALSLTAQTATNLVVEETNGTKTSFPTSQIAGVLFEDAPEYREANHLLQAIYSTSGDYATYSVDFGTDTPDSEGNPSEIGGVQFSLQFIGAQSDDSSNAVLPEGYYRMDNSGLPFSINFAKSGLWERLEEGSEGTVFMIMWGAFADVRRSADGGYDIRVEINALNGQTYYFRYQGKIDFSLMYSDYEIIDEDVNIDFTGGQERYYGNWFMPFADDSMLQFYTGTFNDGAQVEGYWLNLDTYTPKEADPMNTKRPLPDGVYNVDPRAAVEYNSYNPFTFMPGKLMEAMGMEIYVGTYLTYTESGGRRHIALIKEGTFTVSDNGKKIVFDFVADNGIKVQGTYQGNILFANFCDNAEKELPRPYSLLEADKDLLFAKDAVGVYYKEENTLAIGYNTFFMMVMDSQYTEGDFVQLSILSTEDSLTNGTYTVTNQFGNNVIIPGNASYGGGATFSWAGSLEKVDADGYQTEIAPVYSGTMTIADAENGKKTITFDFIDDYGCKAGQEAHKISGTYTGMFYNYEDLIDPQQVKPVKLRSK